MIAIYVVGFIRRKKDCVVETQRESIKDFSNCEWPMVKIDDWKKFAFVFLTWTT